MPISCPFWQQMLPLWYTAIQMGLGVILNLPGFFLNQKPHYVSIRADTVIRFDLQEFLS